MNQNNEPFRITPHTIYLTVGPSGCGKTYFCEKFKQLADLDSINVQHVSSDNIRRELLGKDLDKMDIRMNHISKQAFDMLRAKLTALVSYPVSAEIILLDTLGINTGFRESILKIAKEFHYSVVPIVFDYENYEDYSIDSRNSLVAGQLKRFRTRALQEVSTKRYGKALIIREKDWHKLLFDFSEVHKLKSHLLERGNEYSIIGDVHGCLDELKELIELRGNKIENEIIILKNKHSKLVLIGDYLDKGPQIRETIEFLYKNIDKFYFVIGNHENFVFKYLTGAISKKGVSTNLVRDYFNSIALLSEDEELREKFFTIHQKSKSFLKGFNFICTHAPCEDKYLGKIDKISIKAQQTIRYSKMEEGQTAEEHYKNVESDISFVKEDAEYNRPFHVFGHIQMKSILQIHNKIGIDLGCVAGNKLVCVSLDDSKRLCANSVDSRQEKIAELLPLFNS